MKFLDIKQNSDEWFAARLGSPTSSKFGTVMANYGKAFGAPAKEYALRTVLERMTGERITDGFGSGWMERGTELEPVARQAYEDLTFNTVSNGGIYKTDDGFLGASPDGIIALDNGGIEIKCPKYSTHFATLKRGTFDPVYTWQIVGHIYVCELDYVDFVSFCPDMPEEFQLFIHRVHRNDVIDKIQMLEARMDEFKTLISQITIQLTNDSN